MKDNFYLTLPSNNSFDSFPDNKTTCFTTQLPQRIQLQGEWEVAVVEAHYPQTFSNINESNNIIYYGKMNRYMKKYKLPIGYYFIGDIIRKLNNHPEIGNFLQLSIENFRVKTKPFINGRESVYISEDSDKNQNNTHVEVDLKTIDQVSLSANLALQLGFSLNVNLMDEQYSERDPTIALGVPNQIFLYCNIVESQYVGDTLAPLLRIIHVDKTNYIFGAQTVSLYDAPHYVKISKPEFETIEIDLRTDTGDVVPFLFGTSCVKLHFRRVSNSF